MGVNWLKWRQLNRKAKQYLSITQFWNQRLKDKQTKGYGVHTPSIQGQFLVGIPIQSIL